MSTFTRTDDPVEPFVRSLVHRFEQPPVHIREHGSPALEIGFFILPALQLQEFFHGIGRRGPVVVVADLLHHVVLPGLGVILDCAFDIAGIAKVEAVSGGLAVGIAIALLGVRIGVVSTAGRYIKPGPKQVIFSLI